MSGLIIRHFICLILRKRFRPIRGQNLLTGTDSDGPNIDQATSTVHYTVLASTLLSVRSNKSSYLYEGSSK
jgi:hypothetical protein